MEHLLNQIFSETTLLQTIFSEVLDLFIKQQRRCKQFDSVSGYHNCVRYNDKNQYDPIGILLKDLKYSNKTLIQLVDEDLLKYAKPKTEEDQNKLKVFLSRLQNAHDYSYNLKILKKRLYEIAKIYNLETNKIENIIKWS